jgi:hypothetical protein
MFGDGPFLKEFILFVVGALIGAPMGIILFAFFRKWLSGSRAALAGLISVLSSLGVGQIFFGTVNLADELRYPAAQGIVRIGYWSGLGIAFLIIYADMYRFNLSLREILRKSMTDTQIDALLLSHNHKFTMKQIARVLGLADEMAAASVVGQALQIFSGMDSLLRSELLKRIPCDVSWFRIKYVKYLK